MSSIIFVINEESADDVQKFWGDKFSMMCMEECAELQQAISKYERYPVSDKNSDKYRQNLKEEIRDVMICISGLMNRYYISDGEINEMIDAKLMEDKKR
jgi:NTP pyrophosphatase (non-canonical NTP hydrolase)